MFKAFLLVIIAAPLYAAAIVVLPESNVASLNDFSGVSLSVEVLRIPDIKDGKFSFSIRIGGWPHESPLVLRVNCSKGLECKELEQSQGRSLGDTYRYQALISDKSLNLAEIDAAIGSTLQNTVKSESAVVDLGFLKLVPRIATNIPSTLTSGQEYRIHLWLEDSNSNKLQPTAAIHVQFSSENCADFRYNPDSNINIPSQYVPNAAVTIPSWAWEATGELWIKTRTWSGSTCEITLHRAVVGIDLGDQSLAITIRPNYPAAFIMCLAGALIQYLLSGLVRLIAAARTQEPASFQRIFVGTQGVELFEVLLKGSLAFIASVLFNSADVLGIKIADRNGLIGFISFGFLIGFWPVDRLWHLFKRAATDSDDPEKTGSDSGIGGESPTPSPQNPASSEGG